MNSWRATALLLLLAASLAAIPAPDGEQAGDLLKQKAPRLALTRPGGGEVSEQAFAGTNRILAVSALNMRESQQLLELLSQIKDEFESSGLLVIVVEIRKKGKTAQDSPVARPESLDYFIGQSKQLMVDWKMHYLPTLYFIDDNDIVQGVIEKQSAFNQELIRAAAKNMLSN